MILIFQYAWLDINPLMLYSKTLMSEVFSKLTKGLSSTTTLTWRRSEAACGEDATILQDSNDPGEAGAHRQITHLSRKFSQGEHGTVYTCVMGVRTHFTKTQGPEGPSDLCLSLQ